MAIYKLFTTKDTFIFSEKPEGNAGNDEILELGGYPNTASIGEASRALLQWSTTDIQNVVNTTISGSNWTASIEMKMAKADSNTPTHSVYAYPMYLPWDAGVGKFDDIITPNTVDKTGAGWTYSKANSLVAWTTSSFAANTTASFSGSKQGGGVWYTGSGGTNMEFEQQFLQNSEMDIDINVTDGVKKIYSQSFDNNGFILKLEDNLEFNVSQSVRNKYFSQNTNTIYPPTLTFSWDDSSYSTGSLNVLTSSEAVIETVNNKGEYPDSGKVRFRFLARDRNPVRIFTTGSIYKTNNALPTASYYGIQDVYTEEMEIPFNTGSTKISCDSTGPYFDLHMDFLQPERYYKILVQSTIDSTTTVFDNDNVFKVVRNG